MEDFVVRNSLKIETVADGAAEYDAFLVLNDDNIVVKRTAAQVIAELGALTTYNNSANYAFKTIAVSGQASVVAASNTDTLTLVAGTNVSISTNSTTKAITINSTGGGGITTNKFTFLLDASRSESETVGTISGIYTFRMPYNFEITHTCATISRPGDADLLVDILVSPDIAANLVTIYDSGGSPATLTIRANEYSSYTFSGGQPTINTPSIYIDYLVSIDTSYNGTPNILAGGLKVYITGNIL